MALGITGVQQTVNVLQENLFDVTDLQDREPIVVSKCGTLRVTFHYQVSSGNV